MEGEDYCQIALEEAVPVPVEELSRLFEAGDYTACIARGQALLTQRPLVARNRVRVLAILCRCHLALGNLVPAAALGEEAVDLAAKLQLGELAAESLLDLAVAQIGLRRNEQALALLERLGQALPAHPALGYLQGEAMQRTGEALAQLGRTDEAVDWYERARQWFLQQGDDVGASESHLALIEVCLAAGDREAAERWIADIDEERFDQPVQMGRLLLARARLLEQAGRPDASADEAFRALMAMEELSPVQVEAQLHLSRMAALSGRAVEALSFAVAGRVSAIDGRYYALEFNASLLLIRLIERFGLAAVEELAAEMAGQGVDLYQYLSPEAVRRVTATS